MPKTIPEDTLTLPGYDANAREALAVWECASQSWVAYFADLAKTPTPMGMLEANTRLMADCFSLYGRAANTILQRGGIHTPLLNDA